MRVSDEAVVLLNAPDGTPERQTVIERCAFRPNIFKNMWDASPNASSPPSLENLRYGLIKDGFTERAAGKAAKSYLDTIALVSGKPSLYDSADDEDDGEGEMQQPNEQPTGRRSSAGAPPPPPPPPPRQGMQRAEFPLAEGVARVEFPSGMSAESYQDLDEWLQLVLRRAKRSIAPNPFEGS